MKYSEEQTSPILRKKNKIKSCRVLDIEGKNLIIRDFFNKENTTKFLVSDPGEYTVGSYVDMIFYRVGSISQRMDFVGHTPPDFTPENGEEIF